MAIEFLIGNNFLGIFSTQHPLTPNPVLETFHVIQISFLVRRGVVYEICFFFPPLSSRPFLLYPFFISLFQVRIFSCVFLKFHAKISFWVYYFYIVLNTLWIFSIYNHISFNFWKFSYAIPLPISSFHFLYFLSRNN